MFLCEYLSLQARCACVLYTKSSPITNFVSDHFALYVKVTLRGAVTSSRGRGLMPSVLTLAVITWKMQHDLQLHKLLADAITPGLHCTRRRSAGESTSMSCGCVVKLNLPRDDLWTLWSGGHLYLHYLSYIEKFWTTRPHHIQTQNSTGLLWHVWDAGHLVLLIHWCRVPCVQMETWNWCCTWTVPCGHHPTLHPVLNSDAQSRQRSLLMWKGWGNVLGTFNWGIRGGKWGFPWWGGGSYNWGGGTNNWQLHKTTKKMSEWKLTLFGRQIGSA